MTVCLFVRSHSSKVTRPNFTKFLCMLPVYRAVSVLFLQRFDTLGLSTSSFVDDRNRVWYFLTSARMNLTIS